MKTLGIAVWGLGQHSIKRILPALEACKNISLIGVCSRDQEIVNNCSKYWGCIGWINPNEMLEDVEVEIVYIASPIGLHAAHSKKVLIAGKNVWCEKPLTCNHNDTVSLVNLAKKSNKILTEGFMYIYHPQFKKVQNFIEENQDAGIKSIVCRFCIPKLENPGFRSDKSLCGGAFWDVGSYTISSVLELFPNQDVQILFSEILFKDDEDVDSEGRVLLRFSNGITAYLEWGVGVSYRNEIDILTSKNSLFIDKIFSKPENYEPLYFFRDMNGNQSIEKGEKSEQFIDMFAHFISMFGSSKKINDEYEKIYRRSELMDEIFKQSKLSHKLM